MRAAQDEASVIGRSIRPPRPASAASLPVARFEVQGLKDQIVKDLRPALRVLLTSVAVVLMIVCANVANLLLARATARRREMAVRFAIGAGRARIVRQVLTECLVLAAAGGILGVILGAAGVTLVKQFATIDAPGVFRLGLGSAILPRTMEMGVDRRMLSIALGITTIACGLFGLLPALQVSRAARFQALSARGASASIAATGTRSLLVVGQLVLATVLLVSAGLLVNSFVRLSTVDKGYDASHALAMQIVFPGDYALPRRADLIDTLLARLRRHPDVEFAGFSRAGVLIGEEIAMGVFIPHGRTLGEMRAQPAAPRLRSVTQGFLPAMGIRFVDGRDFDGPAAAAAAPPVVINRSAANHLFGTERALGQVLDWDLEKFRIQVRVIGVVDNLRNESLEQEPFPEIFIDYRALWSVLQRLGDSPPRQTQTALGVLSFAIRTKGDPNAAIPAVRQIVHSVDPDTGIDAIVPIDRLVSSSVARQRFYAVILGVFAGVAGALASIGVYGVLAYAVVQRTQEIGIRMALGAQRAHVLALVLRKGAMLTTVGVGLGLLSAVAVTRLLRGMLFGVTPLDLQTFLAVSIMFFAVAALASYLPARGATLVDPLVALRRDE
jgi:predicted permease